MCQRTNYDLVCEPSLELSKFLIKPLIETEVAHMSTIYDNIIISIPRLLRYQFHLFGQCVEMVDHPCSKPVLDGSWEERPVLRLTDNSCRRPWLEVNCGKLYPDVNRLFSTAMTTFAIIPDRYI